MKKFLLLILGFFPFAGVWAEEVTTEQALEQALEFLTSKDTASGRQRVQGASKQLTLVSKISGLYVFNVGKDGGFVIVSNDDRTIPVLGFSEGGSFNPDSIPDNMRAWLQGYADEIEWFRQHDTNTAAGPKKARRQVGTHPTTAVAPLCTSTWDQDTPYNNLCPTYNDSWYGSGKCATGCVATAMAQVMYYHKWPAKSTKVIPGYTTESYNFHLSDLPIVTLSWSNMKDSYSGSYSAVQATAVATLMKYCGYSVQMDYGPSSGAYTEDVAVALREYFDYNPYTTRFVSRSTYTYANWTDLIYHEVSHKRPVCYGGMSDGGGHEFVCDGYRFEMGTDFFHINWGWGGLSDNYFVLSALDPDQQGIGGSTSTDGFHYGQDAVVGIQKSTASGTIADISPNANDLTLNSITLSDTAVEPHTSVNVTFNITNNSTDPYDGDIWLCLREGDNDYLIECESVVIPAGATQNVTISFTPTETGTYNFVFCYINSNGEYDSESSDQTATLIVAENLTNDIVPVYGYWTDHYSRSQFIIADAELEDMVGGEITGVTFYASQMSVSWGAAKFDVYLSEVNQNTISSLKDWNTLEKVYSGSLSIIDQKMVITFNEPFFYQGGTLLVGINQTVTGSYQKCSWKGDLISGVSVGGYDTSIGQQNFRPKTTFDFTPGDSYVKKPKDVTVNYTGGSEATISWTSNAPTFDLDVNGTITEDVSNPCTLTGLELGTVYIIKVRARENEKVSEWTEPVSFTTSLSESTCQIKLELTDLMGDGWNGAAIKVVDVLTGSELGTFSNTSAAKKNEAQVYYVEVPDDRDIEFQWIKGSYDHECAYAVYDVAGNLIFSGKKKLAEPITYHVNCNAATVITLANDEDNTPLIESFDGKTGCTVKLAGRTLYKDGDWNTLCLPFDLVLEGSPLDGADARTLSSASVSGETVTLDFTAEGVITTLTAGTPYIIRWENGSNLTEADLEFTNVTVSKTENNFESLDGNVRFCGTYVPMTFTDENQSILFIGSGNKLHHPLSGARIGTQRAYFQLANVNSVKQFLLNFGENDPDGIEALPKRVSGDGAWFDLNGRKLWGKPSQKGVYIWNNKTFMIK